LQCRSALVRLSQVGAGFKSAAAREPRVSISRRSLVLVVSVAIGVVAAGAAAWLAQRKYVPPISADDPRQVALGASVYVARCAQCHGANLEGQPNWQQAQANGRLPAPPHDAGGHTWHHPDEILFGITKNGMTPYAPAGYESDMPAFAGTLTDEEIAAVIAFIQSRWPADIRAREARITAQWDREGVTP
jgi:mono/diheme cytochrome c family protein